MLNSILLSLFISTSAPSAHMETSTKEEMKVNSAPVGTIINKQSKSNKIAASKMNKLKMTETGRRAVRI
ncbi:hypothetical protein [Thalassomonas actiniarum]|uniref:Uncharacterized protein n=1 Tax=Thalassomonas actiniarum TaxID=485447 RepID=A0AAE9YVZ5_9GAMM|nr:hypothetical protein [Thalassomonas actiniarum]WDE00572.1 hypothetical protein SG35_008030 [Thalassomonas actiniarum]